VAQLHASDATEQIGFGQSVAIRGNWAVVGAPVWHGTAPLATAYGAAYLFERNASGTWVERAIITPGTRKANDYLGQAVGLTSTSLLVGGSWNGSPVGAAYFF
jgi:FG-GAP repeat